MKILKILNVNMSIDPVTGGGTAERTIQISRALADAGHMCAVLTTDIGFTPELKDGLRGIEIIALPCSWSRFYVPRFSYRHICRLVSEMDVIHMMGHWTFINVLVYFVALRCAKPYIVCPAGALPIYGRSKTIKKIYNLLFGNRIIRNAHGFVAITHDEIKQFIPYGVDPSKVLVIPNGVNANDFKNTDARSFRRKHGLDMSPFLLFVGRLNHIKGPDILLKAFCKLNREFSALHLVIVGPDGGMLSELKAIAAGNDVEKRVHFLGYLGGVDKSQAYNAAELLVIPSRQEAMSIVVLEAGISGTPVLITDRCGFDQLAGFGGGMVVPSTVEGLHDGIVTLMHLSAGLKEMGDALRRQVTEKYTWKKIVGDYVNLFSVIVGCDKL